MTDLSDLTAVGLVVISLVALAFAIVISLRFDVGVAEEPGGQAVAVR
jgi:hypothetical protein